MKKLCISFPYCLLPIASAKRYNSQDIHPVGAGLAVKKMGLPITFQQNPPLPKLKLNELTVLESPKSHETHRELVEGSKPAPQVPLSNLEHLTPPVQRFLNFHHGQT